MHFSWSYCFYYSIFWNTSNNELDTQKGEVDGAYEYTRIFSLIGVSNLQKCESMSAKASKSSISKVPHSLNTISWKQGKLLSDMGTRGQ
jgi:hypothetical protein